MREVYAELCALLPRPRDDTDEARADRDECAIAAVAALHPMDAFQAKLAAHIVAADAHAMECLRLATQAGEDTWEARRCRAQAASMERQMASMLRTLSHVQTGHEPARPVVNETAEKPPIPPIPPGIDLKKLTEVDRYVVQFPERAARIRAAGGLPPRLDFPPPRRAILRALVRGDSAILRALDEHLMAAKPMA